MAAIKIQRFLGEAPKISPELLPDSAAQLSFNTKLYSGDLIPYRLPTVADESGLTGVPTNTIYGLRCPNEGLKWLVWDKDVDIVEVTETQEEGVCNRARFYYTGDGAPKVSDYDLATSGEPPYPINFYDLGLPLPETILTTTAASFSTLTTASFARDAGNTATIVTQTAHGLRSGNIVTISGFTGDPGTSFNVVNTEITVINSTTISYFSPGDQVSTTSNTAGRVALAGGTLPRTYVYTWMTPWDEESIPSEPSDDLYIKEGQTVTITNLPTTKPAGDNFVRGVRVYRTIVSPSGTDYFRLRTLWFPTALAKVARAGNVATITTAFPHNFIVKDRIKISGCTDTSFNITDGEVTEVVNRFTFKFAQTASDVAEKAETTGTMFHDVAESLSDPARYWGDGGNFAFIDDFNVRNLVIGLNSDTYDAPPAALRGLTAIQNNILAGFVGNQLFFSEPGRPHAWPKSYALTFDSNIVGIASVSGYIAVMTETYPFRVSGSDPAIMTYARIDTLFPCLSKRSIVNMGYGVVYATHGGLAVYDPTAGADLVTKFVHDWDTWNDLLDPSTIVGRFYNGKYFASHSTDALIFERDDKIGGFFVRSRYRFDAAWQDPITNRLYYTLGTQGLIYEWDNPGQPLAPLDWKSKVVVNQDYINLGAARVIADYAVPDAESQAIADFNAQVPIFNAQVFEDYLTLSQTAGYERTGNVATITTVTPHRLLTGSITTISGFTSGVGLGFNEDEVEVTVTSATTFTYPNVGTNVSFVSDTTGVVTSLKGLGTLAGPFDALGSGSFRFDNSGTLNSTVVNGDNLLRSTLPIPGVLPVTFRLWADKELVFQATIFDDQIFRLPSGYRADTFEVAVSGSARIRAIHLGETPYGLRTV
jgi:hypothetical protein